MSPTSTRPSQSCCPTTPFSLSDGVDHGHAESVAPPPPPRTRWAMATPSRPAQDDGGFPGAASYSEKEKKGRRKGEKREEYRGRRGKPIAGIAN
uniref:Uncharacterized protein n=1 Tax=Oryza meridionalis TaxID=40149 RepID=A0A0E0CHT2_9ORYZ